MIQYLSILLAAKKAKMDERGASAVEYGLLIAGIAAIIVVAVFLFGHFVSDIFTNTQACIDGGGAGAPCPA